MNILRLSLWLAGLMMAFPGRAQSVHLPSAPASSTNNGSFDEATELGSEAVDEIEHYLQAAGQGYSLFSPMVGKLQSVSPLFNRKGKTVFLSSWGMGPAEIGWLIRLLNDRPTFERYLHETGMTERAADAYNDAYARQLH